MAHIRDIRKPRCWCGKPATKEVYNRRNASIGEYCRRHAVEKCKEMNEREAESDKPTEEP
jgi:hypothetical protein